MKAEQGIPFYNHILSPYVGALLLVIAGLIAYSGTLDHPFHFDDIRNIVENPLIRDINNIPRFFIEIKGAPIAIRSLTSATFAVNYSISELDTASYHVLNIALHIINGLLLYTLVLKCIRRFNIDRQRGNIAALVAALLFMAHPIQTETVTYIVTRSMLLTAFFYFSGFLVFILAMERRKGRWVYVLAMCAISFLGAASREDFVTFPVMLLVFDYLLVPGRSLRDVSDRASLHVAAWLGLFYLSYLVLSHEYVAAGFGISQHTPYEYFITQFKVHWSYLRMIVLPIGQNIDYDYPVSSSLLEYRTFIAFLGYTGLWTIGVAFARKNPVVSFLMLWFMITLTPASSIVPLDDVIFEHRLYIASAGVFVLFALLVSRIKNGYVLSVLVILLSATLVLSTYSRNIVWETEASLWEDAVKKSPQKSRPHFELGTAYVDMGQTDKAISEFKYVLEQKPVFPEADYNLAAAYLNANQVDQAIRHYRRAISTKAGYLRAHTNLSVALQMKGQHDESIMEAKKALAIQPGHIDALNSIASGYLLKGDAAMAIWYLKEAIRIDPSQSASYESLVIAYTRLGQDELAKEALMKAQELRERGK